jgi:hypothetical protein
VAAASEHKIKKSPVSSVMMGLFSFGAFGFTASAHSS